MRTVGQRAAERGSPLVAEQRRKGGRLKCQMLIALAMIVIMLMRPRGLWPQPEQGRSASHG